MNRYPRSWPCIPVLDWPEADATAWKRGLAPASLLSPSHHRASRWATARVRSTEQGYGLFLGYLHNRFHFDADQAPRERINFERVSAYLRDLETLRYAPYTIAARLQQLADTLSVLEPDGDWLWIRRAAGRVRAKARPITDLESRLRSPEEVERLGIDLMNGADRDAADDPLRSALLFRDGLAIATLVHRPLRISNFASIRIGHNLLRDGLLWRVAFPANSMKNRRPYECMWPEPMIAFLEQYLSVHRQILLQKSLGSGEVDALWVTKDGTPIASDALATRIRHHTKAKFGVTINPHSFRGVAATTIATVDPQNNIGVASLLGHSSLETAEKHYIRAKAVDACDRYQATLRRLLQQGRPRYGGGGSNSLT